MNTVAPSTRRAPVWSVLYGVALLAGVTAAALSALSLADALTATGLPSMGLPFHISIALFASS